MLALLLFLSLWLSIVIIKVTNETVIGNENSYRVVFSPYLKRVLLRISRLKCRLLMMIKIIFEIIFLYRKYEGERMTCGKGWVRLKATASTRRASHTQIMFLLLNSCCLADGVHFFFSIIFFFFFFCQQFMHTIALCTMTCDKVQRLLCCILNAPF